MLSFDGERGWSDFVFLLGIFDFFKCLYSCFFVVVGIFFHICFYWGCFSCSCLFIVGIFFYFILGMFFLEVCNEKYFS